MNKEFFILDSADQDDELDTTLDWHTLSRYRRGEGSLFTDEVSEVFNGQKYFKWARLSIQPGERDNTIDNVRRGCRESSRNTDRELYYNFVCNKCNCRPFRKL